MRQFFISFMGTLAGIWASVIIAFIGSLVVLGAIAASMGEGVDNAVSVEKSSVLVLNLEGVVEERESPADKFSKFFSDKDAGSIALNSLVAAVRHAAKDNSVSGLVLECGGVSVGLAQAQEIIRSLEEFKTSGKWIYAYGENYSQADYLIASAADSIYVNPVGMIDIHGLSSTTMFFKGLLDKIGVEAQVVKVGTYKSAVEPFIMSHMSEANREQQQVYLGSIWNTLASQMGRGRELTFEQINTIADSMCYSRPLDFYKNHGLIDGAMYEHEFDKMLADMTGKQKACKVGLDQYVTARNITPEINQGKKTIAVLYAVGDITESGEDGIVSDQLVPEIFRLSENDDIDGLILRVNSGGGSAFASELIWNALEEYKKKTGNPFYVSMSDYAASGGYYISCGADRIYAEPTTLTGSIGIFGIIPDGEKLLDQHLGITTETVSTNPEGSFPSFFKAMTPGQRNAMQGYVNRGYELFVSRCAKGRHISTDSIKAIAEGRVWDGKTALSIGLVDQLGGLDNTIADMKSLLEVEECQIRIFPEEKFDFMRELKKSMSIMSTGIVKSELGDFYPFYKAAKQIKSIDPLQCRMDFTIIE